MRIKVAVGCFLTSLYFMLWSLETAWLSAVYQTQAELANHYEAKASIIFLLSILLAVLGVFILAVAKKK